jgi:hypothetical protein
VRIILLDVDAISAQRLSVWQPRHLIMVFRFVCSTHKFLGKFHSPSAVMSLHWHPPAMVASQVGSRSIANEDLDLVLSCRLCSWSFSVRTS